MYVVKSGEVELKVHGKTVEVVGTDGFFGEMVLVDQAPRSATAVAKTDCVVIPISEKHFLFMVEETPFFCPDCCAHLDRPVAANGPVSAIISRGWQYSQQDHCRINHRPEPCTVIPVETAIPSDAARARRAVG
jgi:Cyclic nucleotide-binding domain